MDTPYRCGNCISTYFRVTTGSPAAAGSIHVVCARCLRGSHASDIVTAFQLIAVRPMAVESKKEDQPK